MALASSPSAFTPAWPMGYLTTFGPRADPAMALTWGLLAISITVVIIISALVIVGLLVRRAETGRLPVVSRGDSGLIWIYVGTAITVVVLIGSMIWTVEVLAKVTSPPTKPAFTIEITGHQWWWEARYLWPQPDQDFNTANELHIPVGQPVLVKVTSADVIHSFWIPALTGKTDTIPGRVNLSWLQASRPGVYRGQCTEYCGEEHAKMALYAIAQPPADFEAWRKAQVAAAATPTDPEAIMGLSLFVDHCGACHEVRGTSAGGLVGPDLTHIASRQTIASGILQNSPVELSAWISDPQTIKPGAKMPATNLPRRQLNAVIAYLETLK